MGTSVDLWIMESSTSALPSIGSPGPKAAGFTLVEIIVTMTVLMIAALGALGSISTFGLLSGANEESTIAHAGAQSMLESMRREDFSELFVRFNDFQGDDPAGVVSPGANFDVPGLTGREGDADGLVGEIIFPVPDGSPGQLREDHVDAGFGFPRDLNGDRAEDSLSHEGDYLVLPVRIRVRWRGRSGNRQVELQSILRPE